MKMVVWINAVVYTTSNMGPFCDAFEIKHEFLLKINFTNGSQKLW